jgi:Fe-S oxidoreductase
VGIDPSMTLTYRAEYVKALGKGAVPHVALPQEWLAARLQELPRRKSSLSGSWALLPHCTEKTNAPAATADWVRVYRALGLELQIVPSGCCGMAGLYGHERVHRPTSESIYMLSWERIVADRRHAGRLMASGFSCRCQVADLQAVQLPHPVQVLLRTLQDAGREPRERAITPMVEREERHEEV